MLHADNSYGSHESGRQLFGAVQQQHQQTPFKSMLTQLLQAAAQTALVCR